MTPHRRDPVPRRRRPAPPGWRSCPASPPTTSRSCSAPAGAGRRRARPRPTPRSRWPSSAASPPPTVAGHVAMARSLTIGQLRVLVYLGRMHLYEGHPASDGRARRPDGRRPRAAGGRADQRRGRDPRRATGSASRCCISDHLNLTGRSPLTGPPPPAGYPSRFTDLTDAVLAAAAGAGPGGPTRAWPRASTRRCRARTTRRPPRSAMLRALGADLVGHVHRAGGDRRPPPGRRGARRSRW